jgi:hypothetical protein
MRKKLTSALAIGAFLMLANNSNATIVYTNITDTPLPTDGSNFDINMDNSGAAEFSFTDMMGPYITFETNNHLATVSDINTGQGWDVVKGFTLGTTINANSGYYDQGDGFIAPDFATGYYTFPTNVDTYLACKFNIGASTYYGWIRVNWNGTTLVFKDYAYQNTANTSINAGDMSTGGSTNGISSIDKSDFEFYPNPFSTEINFKITDKNSISSVSILAIDGTIIEQIKLNEMDQKTNLSHLTSGSYFVRFEMKNGEIQIQKIIKN